MRLKTYHQPQKIVPVDNAVQGESPPVAENHSSPLRDWSYAFAGNDLDEDETEQNTDPWQSDPRYDGWFLCYPQDCCANISILVQ